MSPTFTHCALAIIIASASATGVAAESIQGCGATFPAPLYAVWTETYNRSNTVGSTVDYQPIGSGGGIKGITDRTVQFAGSDAPLTDEQLAAAPGKLIHLPTVAGPVVMTYNLPHVEHLLMNADLIAGIYLGEITKWSDPKIAAINPGLTLPDLDISVAHRSDGSGTTWIFTNYLSKVSPSWKSKVGNATSVKWPVGLGGKGNAGVAAAVQNSEGGFGYVELAYAIDGHLAFCPMINKAGKTVNASIDAVNAAIANSTAAIPDDLRMSITDAPGDASYPICGFTYLLVYQDLSYFKDPKLAAATVAYLDWCEHDGQAMAKSKNYAQLSPDLQAKVEAKLKSIVVDGQPVLASAQK